MRRGYMMNGPDRERDLLACGHCQAIITVPPGRASVPVPFCRTCMRYECAACAGAMRCVVWEKRIEAQEQRGVERSRRFREMGIPE